MDPACGAESVGRGGAGGTISRRAAAATSAPQPVGALIAFLAVGEVSGLLPFSFAFAAGAMLALIVVEMLPKAYAKRRPLVPSVGVAIGATVMLGLSFVLGV